MCSECINSIFMCRKKLTSPLIFFWCGNKSKSFYAKSDLQPMGESWHCCGEQWSKNAKQMVAYHSEFNILRFCFIQLIVKYLYPRMIFTFTSSTNCHGGHGCVLEHRNRLVFTSPPIDSSLFWAIALCGIQREQIFLTVMQCCMHAGPTNAYSCLNLAIGPMKIFQYHFGHGINSFRNNK